MSVALVLVCFLDSIKSMNVLWLWLTWNASNFNQEICLTCFTPQSCVQIKHGSYKNMIAKYLFSIHFPALISKLQVNFKDWSTKALGCFTFKFHIFHEKVCTTVVVTGDVCLLHFSVYYPTNYRLTLYIVSYFLDLPQVLFVWTRRVKAKYRYLP